MENKIKILNEIEADSIKLIHQTDDWFKSTRDIKWFSNEVGNFEDERITDYYINNDYGKKTRWDVWNSSIDILKKYNVKNILDIGCANGHFVFLAQKNNIDSFGIEPRQSIVNTFQSKFIKEFGQKKLFISNYEYFIDFLIENKENMDFKFDCICILNFMHGKGHNPNYLEKFFNNIFNFCDYLLTSEPIWKEYDLKDMLSNRKKIECIPPTNQHFLFK